MTQVWGEIVRDLADSTLIPFSVVSLAEEMNTSWHGVREELNNTPGFNPTNELELGRIFSFSCLSVCLWLGILVIECSEHPPFAVSCFLDAFSSAVSLFGKSAKTLIDDLSKFQTDGRLKKSVLNAKLN
jgi:hypothetical protein